ncbi:hypothetical protein FA95DRAFT_1575449 [Auriscalpium vulgare]|uniref:Uncharacterized protein n=1 Tax=Auriscalpium vulgare TaxID=40419 RepID=A0ACB8RG38_9AGAM|nr:hypothetical protein FA95DRAFT_1575449 [Auriscalpium vulgare]
MDGGTGMVGRWDGGTVGRWDGGTAPNHQPRCRLLQNTLFILTQQSDGGMEQRWDSVGQSEATVGRSKCRMVQPGRGDGPTGCTNAQWTFAPLCDGVTDCWTAGRSNCVTVPLCDSVQLSDGRTVGQWEGATVGCTMGPVVGWCKTIGCDTLRHCNCRIAGLLDSGIVRDGATVRDGAKLRDGATVRQCATRQGCEEVKNERCEEKEAGEQGMSAVVPTGAWVLVVQDLILSHQFGDRLTRRPHDICSRPPSHGGEGV